MIHRKKGSRSAHGGTAARTTAWRPLLPRGYHPSTPPVPRDVNALCLEGGQWGPNRQGEAPAASKPLTVTPVPLVGPPGKGLLAHKQEGTKDTLWRRWARRPSSAAASQTRWTQKEWGPRGAVPLLLEGPTLLETQAVNPARAPHAAQELGGSLPSSGHLPVTALSLSHSPLPASEPRSNDPCEALESCSFL